MPHEDALCDAKASHEPVEPPLQQPLGQVLMSHSHVPKFGSQRPFVQDAQTWPPVPHWVGDSEEYGTHVPPRVAVQQPFGHEVPSQTHCPASAPIVLHSWPVPHAPHAPPPVPQEPLDSLAYASQVPLEVQHPVGHELASQTHCPVLSWHS